MRATEIVLEWVTLACTPSVACWLLRDISDALSAQGLAASPMREGAVCLAELMEQAAQLEVEIGRLYCFAAKYVLAWACTVAGGMKHIQTVGRREVGCWAEKDELTGAGR